VEPYRIEAAPPLALVDWDDTKEQLKIETSSLPTVDDEVK